MLFIRSITNCWVRFIADRQAAIAPTFALLLVPLLGLTGFGVDLSMMLAERTRAQNIVDAGALNGVRLIQSYMDTNGNTVANFNIVKTTAQANTVVFMQALAKKDTSITNAVPILTPTFANNTISVVASLNFDFQTAFMGLFGIDTVAMSSSSSAVSTPAKFTQVVFLIDVSGSMGVAATSNDMANMAALVATLSGGQLQGCSFACHQSTLPGQYSYVPIDFRIYTKQAGIKSKIDYAITAVEDFTTQLGAASTSAPGHFSTSIYTFGADLNTVQPPTTDFSQINSLVSNIDLDLYISCVNATCPAWTSTTSAMTTLKSKIQNVGDGSSPTSMITYLIVVTDGVEEIFNPSATFGHQTDTTWTSTCSAFKAIGVNLATVQAQYLPLTGNGQGDYDLLVAPIASQITPAMTACASSNSLALSASDGPGLQTAIEALFAVVTASPRLTN